MFHHFLAINRAIQPSHGKRVSSARRCQRLKAQQFQHPCRPNIPWIWNHKGLVTPMQGPKQFPFFLLCRHAQSTSAQHLDDSSNLLPKFLRQAPFPGRRSPFPTFSHPYSKKVRFALEYFDPTAHSGPTTYAPHERRHPCPSPPSIPLPENSSKLSIRSPTPRSTKKLPKPPKPSKASAKALLLIAPAG